MNAFILSDAISTSRMKRRRGWLQQLRRRLRSRAMLVALTSVLCMLPSACSDTQSVRPDILLPNILLIVLDDFGYNDLAANGNPVAPTPELDALANAGVRYTRHYADATCSVARAALLTGTYPAAFGFRPTHLGLSPGTVTIASELRDAGYTTRHIGKWHVGNPTLRQSPSALGFDHWYGFLLQSELGGESVDGINFSRGDYRDPWLRDGDTSAQKVPGHLTDILTDRAVEFIVNQGGAAEPWFLNLWFYAPHAPVQPASEFAAQFPDTANGRYLALLAQLDHSVGRVLEALRTANVDGETLVLVVSDNGGSQRFAPSNAPFFGGKGMFTEGGLRTPLLLHWPGRTPVGEVNQDVVSLYDIMPTLLAAAQRDLPEQAIGRNLLETPLAAPPRLFWEYSNSLVYQMSALSADGRWRYSYSAQTGRVLNDLRRDPTGEANVIDAHRQVAAELQDDWQQWRLSQREVALQFSPLNQDGAGQLSGSDLLRSPGYRGFTFALGVAPGRLSADAQTLVQQAGRWSLRLSSQALQVDLPGQRIELPPLPVDVCSQLVVATHYAFSPIMPETNFSIVEVFLNGKRVAERVSAQPSPQLDGYEQVTRIGSATAEGPFFTGWLSPPLVLNERLKAEAESGELRDSIDTLPDLCRGWPGHDRAAVSVATAMLRNISTVHTR